MPQTEKINISAANSTTQTSNSVKYGELVILGYNGCLFNGDKGRRRSKFQLFKRQVPNGVKAAKHHIVNNPQQSELIQNCHQHSVSYTLSRSQAVIVEYDHDCNTDMFQIGRSSEEQIDFVVMDTIPGTQRGDQSVIMQSTISRYACRILVDRTHPYAARIYAAGFDNGKNIFLGEKATKWYTDGEIDGLTTNGILIMHPINGFTENSKTGLWRELSVEGGLYALRESRSAPNKGNLVSTENNVLKDGTLIDLCGATLVWRSNEGLVQGPTLVELEKQIEQINASRPQCPVGLNTLVLPCKNSMTDNEKAPYVYLKCGHVHGQHSWGKGDDLNNCTCPMCREVGPFVKLQLGEETSFYNDNGIITHCFSPCGHMASEKTVRYWSTVQIPHGCLGFQPACPFCATVLNELNPWVRLIFQDNMD
ncbi:hypothetical protein HELRODRAFT_184813 [Helobdella robusta]|uniref:Protein pellino n=1 Tax=Helobdella robusta TaxID=6412 RepID=T1FM15_HELRO|nr:hypothetical protein HELRODRAFT_184813 [Helobdella robusta]ESO12018.1 hypothetical protein HELRODRAFT_184813 [Helobdella robusta]